MPSQSSTAAAQPRRDLGELLVPDAVLVDRAADDQRGPGLVDQDRVDLVDDREVMAALHALLEAPGHVVPEVVEAELVVRPVGDIGGVLLAALLGVHLGQDHPDLETEEPVDPAHPLRVALGQVVVDGDNVHALAGQGVQVGGEHAGDGLALTGLHLGDVAQVQRAAAHDLHVEMTLAQRALSGLAHRGERLGHQVIQRLALGVPLLEVVGQRAELGVG